MHRSGSFFIAMLASGLLASVLQAQQRATPGVRFRNKIVVTVYVTLSDEKTAYYPVGDYKLVIYRSPSDSVVLVTDPSGVASSMLRPGDYRIVSAAPIEWRGASYSWNLPLPVYEGMGVADLSRQNAIVHETIAGAVVAELPMSRASGGVPPTRRVIGYKDPTTATLFAFLLTGGGHMYAGEGGKGAALLGASFGAFSLGLAMSDTENREPVAVGLLTSLGIWIYGMMDAGPAARRENAKNGLTVSQRLTFASVAEPGRNRTMLMGVSISRVGRHAEKVKAVEEDRKKP